jgi:hypothetical protein
MATIEAMSRAPRMNRFWMRCPAPGISHASAGATIDMGVIGAAVALILFVFSTEEFAIQIITISS